MATSEPQGTGASIWAHAPSTTAPNGLRNWAREKEPGSAFRGIPRGRGRGRGRGSSDRGGRKPSNTDTAEPARKSNTLVNPSNSQTHKIEESSSSLRSKSQTAQPIANKTDSLKQPASSSESPSTEISSAANSARTPRSRPHSKRGSQRSALKVPELRVDTSNAQIKDKPLPSATELTVNTPNRPGHNRRGSRHRLRTPTTPAKGHINESEPQARTLQRGPRKKDTSPHFSTSPATPSFNTHHNVDSLVEHYRASAMEQHRPGSPNSHLDWAGEEDDTLPDLDDWMIESKSASASGYLSPINEKPQGTSPVEITGKSESPGGDKISPSNPIKDRHLAQDPAKGKKNDRKRGRGREKEKEKGTNSITQGISPDSTLPMVSPPKVKDLSLNVAKVAVSDDHVTPPASTPTEPNLPKGDTSPVSDQVKESAEAVSGVPDKPEATKKLHPSLPEKPQSQPTLPKHPLPSKPDTKPWRSTKISEEQLENMDNSTTPTGPSTISKPPIELELKLDQFEKDPGEELIQDEGPPSNSTSLEALVNLPHSAPPVQVIHAEGSVQEQHSHMSTLSVGSIDGSFMRPGSATPRRGRDHSPLGVTPNARARSSPQTGPRTAFIRTRPPAASRPIITFSALQQISKSLGTSQKGVGVLSRRDETPAASAVMD